MSEPKPTAFVTHKDLDGAACAVIAHRVWYSDGALEVFYEDHHGIDDLVLDLIKKAEAGEYRQIVVADISPVHSSTLTECIGFQNRGGKILILDHHANSTFAQNEGFYELGNLGKGICGARMMFDHYRDVLQNHGELYPLQVLVQIAETRDLWRKTDAHWPASLRLNKLFLFLGMERFVARCLTDLAEEKEPSLLTMEEETLLEVLEEKDAKYIRKRVAASEREEDDAGHIFRWVICSRLTSEIGNTIMEEHPDADYALMYMPEYSKVEMRSREGGFDVGKLAKTRGGGGHQPASGYPVKPLKPTFGVRED